MLWLIIVLMAALRKALDGAYAESLREAYRRIEEAEREFKSVLISDAERRK